MNTKLVVFGLGVLALCVLVPTALAQETTTGAEAAVTTPAEFALFLRQEWAAYGQLVEKLQLKPE